MFGMFKKLKLETQTEAMLETQSEAMFATLHGHGVFGEIEGKWFDLEKRVFKRAISAHAESRDHNRLELTYPSNVRLLIAVTTNEKNEVIIKDIKAYDHPRENKAIDYEALNFGLDCARLLSV